ncbi:MAG: ATP-binding protein, partial [Candidatus Omnitrophica bacterium]|nr:ATP-binding protein [Candidatus Omnitrophota bacterium]
MPINVIVGRNNSGKSHLLELAETLCGKKTFVQGWQYNCRGVLDEELLKRVFPTNQAGGDLGGSDSHWEDHGKQLVGAQVTFEIDSEGNATSVNIAQHKFKNDYPFNDKHRRRREETLKGALHIATHSLLNHRFRRLLADRDIRP